MEKMWIERDNKATFPRAKRIKCQKKNIKNLHNGQVSCKTVKGSKYLQRSRANMQTRIRHKIPSVGRIQATSHKMCKKGRKTKQIKVNLSPCDIFLLLPEWLR